MFGSATHILLSSLRNTNAVSCSMPGRKEQNKKDSKKASANCSQLGIRKKVNEAKNSFPENQNRSTQISPDLTNRSQDIPCTSKENNTPCSEHI